MRTFQEFMAMQEGLLLPDRPPAKGLPRLNATPFTNVSKKRLHATPVKPPNLFPPTISRVAEIVPNKLIPKLKSFLHRPPHG